MNENKVLYIGIILGATAFVIIFLTIVYLFLKHYYVM